MDHAVAPGKRGLLWKLVALSNLTFLVLFVIVSWHNRLAEDDYRFLDYVHQHGILGATHAEYNTWTTRYVSIFLCDLVLNFIQYKYTLFAFCMAEIILFICSLAFLLNSVLKHYTGWKYNRFMLLSASTFITSGFFYTVMGIDQTWFWLSSATTYIWSIIFLFFGVALVIDKGRPKLQRYAGIAICSFLIGGSYEVLSAFILVCTLMAGAWAVIKGYYKKEYNIALFIALASITCAIVIMMLGHGNAVRRQFTIHISPFAAAVLNARIELIILTKRLSHVLPFTILFTLPFVYLGYRLSVTENKAPKSLMQIAAHLLKCGMLYLVLIYSYNYPITYLLAVPGPDRALAFASLLTYLLFAYSFFYIGMYYRFHLFKWAWITLFFCLGFNIYNGADQYLITSKYAEAYDKWMVLLDSEKEQMNNIELEPLPPSGMICTAASELQFLQHEKGLKATIVIKAK
jgi:hypothetical protein